MNDLSVIICRCEEVTASQLEKAYESGCITTRQLKLKTRVTMGACQGRMCRHLTEAWLHLQNPAAVRDAELLSFRMPVRQITFGQLANGEA